MKSKYTWYRLSIELLIPIAVFMYAHVAHASSYASNLTNNTGTVSFRLNDDADSVKVIGNAGTLTNDLGALPRGLTVTNLAGLGMTGGVFKVVVFKTGTGVPALIGTNVPFGSPRGVTVNINPASPYFGRVYVANSATNANNKGDGLFIFSSDLSDTFGQGTTPRTGGITNFGLGAAASPYRIKVGRDDDQLYITDFSDAAGNLYVTDPDITNASFKYALKQLTTNHYGSNISAIIPVGTNNNHGSTEAVEVTGSLGAGTLKVYTLDEDYQSDPTVGTDAGGGAILNQRNSLWQYNVGAGPLPWNNVPDARLMTPTIGSFSQTMDLAMGSNGYFYVSDLRSSGNEAGVFVVDGAGNPLYNSHDDSVNLGNAVDFLTNIQGMTVSPDQKYLAVVNINNVITIVPLVNGIPNLVGRFTFTGLGTTGNARGLAFDSGDNLYLVSSGLGILQAISVGFTATITTGSDGSLDVITPATQVTASPDITTLSEADLGTSANILITRTNDNNSTTLAVNFVLSGTATRNADYVIKTNGVVITNANVVFIPAGSENVTVTMTPLDDTISELVETANFTLSGGNYGVIAPNGGTLAIIDNDTPMIDITNVVFNSMFEGNPNDLLRYRLTRRGDTNAPSFNVSIAYAGTATANVDYTPVPTVAVDPGAITADLDVHPLNDNVIESPKTVIASVIAGAGYLVGTNSALTTNAVGTIIDDDQPAETVLFSDNFDVDTASNWKVAFAALADPTEDFTVTFNYDYGAAGIPSAPHSAGDTHGLLLTVNKNDTTTAAAALNLYPIGQSFSNNFALRFDMYLQQNGNSGTTEYALFGVNHSGNQTNWFRNSLNGNPGFGFDGVWAYVEADGAALGDYILNTAPAVTNAGLVSPTTVASRNASTLTQTFHQPPWTSGSGPGAPGNTPATTTPSWAQVELSQIGKIISLKINNTSIFSYSNTTAFTNGNIMLGYDDAFDSIGSGGGQVIYDNVRVVGLPAGFQIQTIAAVSTNAQIDFGWFLNDPATAFKLQVATNVGGPYIDDTNTNTTYTVLSPASSYRIVTPRTTATRFYRVRHL